MDQYGAKHGECQGERLCSPTNQEVLVEGTHKLQVWEDGRVQIVPHPAQEGHIVRHAHEELGHFGVKQTYNLLLGQYWWRGMHTDVQ